METLTYDTILLYYKLFNNIILQDGEYSLPRELKVKILKNRFNTYTYYKEYHNFEIEEKNKLAINERYVTLVNKKRNKSEQEELEKLEADLYQVLRNRVNEVTLINIDYFTEEEFEKIIEVNVNNSPNIDNRIIPSEVFLTYIYDNLVDAIPYKIEFKEEAPN